ARCGQQREDADVPGFAGTLELNTAGALTLTSGLAVGANTVKLDGALSTLTDAAGVTLGASGMLIGMGTVAAPVSGTGTIKASGGVLDLTGAVSSGPLLQIDTIE